MQFGPFSGKHFGLFRLLLLVLVTSASGLAQSPNARSPNLEADPTEGVSRLPPIDAHATAPKYIDYNPGQLVPEGYRLSTRYRRGPVIAGSITFGIGYGLGALVALSDTKTDFERHWLLLPIVGPFIGLATQRDTCQQGDPHHCNHNERTITVLAILGAMQVTGVALFAYGELDRKTVLVRKDDFSLRLAPAALGLAGQGLAAFGEY